jgi:hypothetical protein
MIDEMFMISDRPAGRKYRGGSINLVADALRKPTVQILRYRFKWVTLLGFHVE